MPAKCKVLGCTKQPSFALPGGTASRCSGHADPGMVDVKSKKCTVPGCAKKSIFALPGDKPSRCAGHADPGMVHV